MDTICYELFRNILHTLHIRLIHRIITSHLMKLSSLCRDMKENVKYRQKSPERTNSISVILKLLLECVFGVVQEKKINVKIFMKIIIE